MFKLPQLPYDMRGLIPLFSEEQLKVHYDRHHRAYIEKLNKLIETDSELRGKTMEEIILTSSGPAFNNAAQAWNHTFFFYNMAPNGNRDISTPLSEAITRDFGNRDALKTKFVTAGTEVFGSGWIWLCMDDGGRLSLLQTSNAMVPYKEHRIVPLLTADVWEHAYYVDYKNERTTYLEKFWDLVNWEFVSQNYESKKVRSLTSLMT